MPVPSPAPLPPDPPVARALPDPASPLFLYDGETPSMGARRRRAATLAAILASLEKAVCSNGGRSAAAPGGDIDTQNLPYPCRRWFWRNQITGKLILYRCRRWSCPDCASYLVERWSKLILEAPIQRHVTLTNLGQTNAEATARLKGITKAIRRGEAVRRRKGRGREAVKHEYFAALEGHGRAGIHAHLLQHGRSLPQRALSSLAARYGGGAVVWVRSISEDELPRQVVEYVVRHLVGVVHPDQPKIGRRIRYTKGFWNGLRRAEVAAQLWPPPDEPGVWELVKPDLEMMAADRELHQLRKSHRDQDRKTKWEAEMLRRYGWTPPLRAQDL